MARSRRPLSRSVSVSRSAARIFRQLASQDLKRLCREHHVRELSVFGSLVKPTFRPKSDVDLLVEFEPGAIIGLLALARLRRELASLLGRPVDLVPKSGLKPLIRDDVLASARVIYAA